MSESLDTLSDAEMLRYNRQIILKHFDFDGQEALKDSRVLIIGAGGLGCASSQYLATAGVGQITLVDFDRVELSNLQRQVLHHDADIGRYKVDSAVDSLKQLNPYCEVEGIARQLDDDALNDLIAQHTLVIDATDNITTRNQLNQLCFAQKVPLISGAAIRMEGHVSVFTYQDADDPCYACLSALFGENTLTCVESGIMAPVVGIIGAVQAMEAIKVIATVGQPLSSRLLMLDAMSMSWRTMALMKNPQCPVCGSATHRQEVSQE
ncbi:molybdopterin-synthase adenylyltransferase MoeB [Vibrio zhugei]|uniref:Molybdopterin-synthase adenylyltransferase MoeB n=1 Tax=Vibrio zhugei TaxID=2479546 RepID=A0ABV7CDG4_9VIBR|nr:molybdopterin-synthase adenylyltransferase MoeB [Vibrio zhugei]